MSCWTKIYKLKTRVSSLFERKIVFEVEDAQKDADSVFKLIFRLIIIIAAISIICSISFDKGIYYKLEKYKEAVSWNLLNIFYELGVPIEKYNYGNSEETLRHILRSDLYQVIRYKYPSHFSEMIKETEELLKSRNIRYLYKNFSNKSVLIDIPLFPSNERCGLTLIPVEGVEITDERYGKETYSDEDVYLAIIRDAFCETYPESLPIPVAIRLNLKYESVEFLFLPEAYSQIYYVNKKPTCVKEKFYNCHIIQKIIPDNSVISENHNINNYRYTNFKKT